MVASQVLKQSVMVFSKNYLPINQMNVKRSLALLIIGKAEALFANQTGWILRSPNLLMTVPPHILLTIVSTRLRKISAVNRLEVLRRDNHTCQYYPKQTFNVRSRNCAFKGWLTPMG